MERVVTKQKTTEDLWEEYLQNKEEDIRNTLVIRYGYIVKCIALKTVGGLPAFHLYG